MPIQQSTQAPGTGIKVTDGNPYVIIKGDGTTIEIAQVIKGKNPPRVH